MEYGYVRVSDRSQNPDRQIRELRKQGIEQKNIFVDKFSGKTCVRPAFKKLLNKLKENDVLYVTSFDRLGRNYKETTDKWFEITKKKSRYRSFRFSFA
ncbi:recombinase family protein [Faecalimonas sp.]